MYELASYLLSFFYEERRRIRKGTNLFLYKAISSINELLQPDNNILHVLDDGSLIHRMVWHRNDSYEQICMNYAQYIRRHYGNNWTVVFDGYPTDADSRNRNTEIYRRFKALMLFLTKQWLHQFRKKHFYRAIITKEI